MQLTLDSTIEQFLIDQELKGNTKKTLSFYRHDLGYLSDFLGKDKKVNEITIADLKQYLIMLKNRPRKFNEKFKPKTERPISTVTIQTYVRAVRAFLGWLYNEGYITDDLRKNFKLPKAIKKTVEILSDEEIDKLFKCMRQNTEIGLRNACICALMIDCGLRRNEAIFLNYDNIHISQGVIKVVGKGQKERIVPLGLYTKKLLVKYISGMRPLPAYDTKRLFIDRELKPVSENCIKELFVRLRKRTGIARLHPHMLRHTFATKYLMNGGDIFSLQQILGHTSLEMVRKYSHIASSYIIQTHKRFSPLDNLERKKHGFNDTFDTTENLVRSHYQ